MRRIVPAALRKYQKGDPDVRPDDVTYAEAIFYAIATAPTIRDQLLLIRRYLIPRNGK
jgi:hypothetical protein